MRTWAWVAVGLTIALAAPARAASNDWLLARADRWYDEQTWDRALADYDSWVARNVGDARVARALWRAAQCCQRLPDRWEARQNRLHDLLAGFPNTTWAARALADRASNLWHRRTAEPAWEHALAVFTKAIGTPPSAEDHADLLAMLREAAQRVSVPIAFAYLDRAFDLAMERDTKAAILLQRADFFRPEFGGETGRWYNEGHEPEEERILIRLVRAFDDTPTAAKAWLWLGEISEGREDYLTARARFYEAARRGPLHMSDADANGRLSAVMEARRQLRRMAEAHCELATPATALPDAPITARLHVRNVDSVLLTAYRCDTPATAGLLAQLAGADMSGGSMDWHLRGLAENGEDPFAAYQPVARATVPVNNRHDFRWLDVQAVLPNLSPATYIIRAGTPNDTKAADAAFLTIGRMAIVAHDTTHQLMVGAADRAGGQPLADTEVQLLGVIKSEKEPSFGDMPGSKAAPITPSPTAGPSFGVTPAAKGRTGADGLVALDRALPRTAASRQPGEWERRARLVFARHGDETAMVLVEGFDEPSSYDVARPELHAHLSTDRPLYRPGDIVRFQIILRRAVPTGFESVAGQKFYVVTSCGALGERAVMPRPVELTADAFGCLHGEIKLDPGARLGTYSVHVYEHVFDEGYEKAPPSPYGDGAWAGSYAVEEYRKPDFRVMVTAPERAVRGGETVTVPLHAVTYDGSPVALATVHWRLRSWENGEGQMPRQWLPPERRRTRAMRRFSEAFRDDVPEYPAAKPGREFEEDDDDDDEEDTPEAAPGWPRGEARTDAHGEAQLTFVMPRQNPRHFFHGVFVLSADVTDAARRTISASCMMGTSAEAFRLSVGPRQHVWSAGETAVLDISAFDWVRHAVETRLSVALYRLRYVPHTAAEEGGHWERAERLWTRTPQTDATTGDAELPFETPSFGHYQAVVTATDPWSGEEISATTAFWSSGSGHEHDGYATEGLALVPVSDEVEAGGQARLLVSAPRAGGWLMLTNESVVGSQTLAVHLDNQVEVVQLALPSAWLGATYVVASFVGPEQTRHGGCVLFITPARRALTVKVEPDAPLHKPGEHGHFAVSTTDATGQPVSAEVCLAVADDSLFAVTGERAQPLADLAESSVWDPGRPPHAAGSDDVTGFFAGRDAYGSRRDRPGYTLFRDPYAKPVEIDTGGAGGGEDNFQPSAGRDAPPKPAPPPAAPKAAAPAAPKSSETEPPIATREFFPDAIAWQPAVVTGADGRASLEVTFPDSLTTWRASAAAVTTDSQVGETTGQVTTSKDLVCRLAVPRFLTQLDQGTVSVLVNNNTDRAQDVAVTLSAEGVAQADGGEATLTIAAHGQARLDRVVRAVTPGRATFTATARGADDSDAVKQAVDVIPHAAPRFDAAAGKVPASGVSMARLELPAAHRSGSARLTVTATPSLVVSLLDALPYLIDYPYGCAEQTASRLLPAVLAARALHYAPAPTNAAMPPQVPPWWTGRGLPALGDVIAESQARLAKMQTASGGYAWFPGLEADPYITAYVMDALAQARGAGVTVDAQRWQRAVGYLKAVLRQTTDNAPLTAYVAWVLIEAGAGDAAVDTALDHVYAKRAVLNDYTRALLVLSLCERGQGERAQVVWRNLQSGRIETETGVHWCQRAWGGSWSWDQVETTAFALRAALRVEPGSPLADKAARWLAENRQGTRWYSTKDTALAIDALVRYAEARGELAAGGSSTLSVNGRPIKGWEFTPQTLLDSGGTVVVGEDQLQGGANTLEIRREGAGALYWTARLEYDSTADFISAASSHLSVRRAYRRADGRPLLPGEPLQSGERVEVELTLEADNELSYVAIADPKPAGCEPLDQLSGPFYQGCYAYRELHDKEVALFLPHLAQGVTKLDYALRAEAPGTWRALPGRGFAFYRADVRGLSDEAVVTVRDAER